MTGEPLWAMVPRTPWRIALTRTKPAHYGDATPLLCLPPARAPAADREVWRFDWLDSGASDRCLAGCTPEPLRQIAAVVALIQADTGAARVSLLALAGEIDLAQQFAATYPFAIARVILGDDHEQSHRRDLRGAAA